MAEERDFSKSEGEIVNPKPEDTPVSAAAAAAAAGDQPSPVPAPTFPTISVNIWPPTQRTRDAVINRLVENLSSPSILSKRYGTLPADEASAVARQIEQEAFAVASASSPSSAAGDDAGRTEASIDEGIEILQIYSKEISRRMLESVKARASSASPAPAEGNVTPAGEGSGDAAASDPKPPVPPGDEISSDESQPPAA
ncbi:MFP1 attachment factor 1 [Apostasia shenzhenica]|uniref:MFP1 attachment factor 1 n=1 Tax=Apostasia shenzhenica TaxID=1088818 RepID=A0A2I0AWD1_9ASPA|nr:MFP1 attachment factor 1 [Apostasia shenzhenica]